MRLDPSIRNAIVFIGREDKTAPGGFKSEGTGFLLHYKGCPYLVSCRHVAEPVEDENFSVRVNRRNSEGSNVVPPENAVWFYHNDKTIDLAVTYFPRLNEHGFECQYIPEIMMLDSHPNDVDAGDFCYTVGLFKYTPGTNRNLPVVYTGHIALNSPELVHSWNPHKNRPEDIEGCLIQGIGISGISGSPVLVRRGFPVTGAFKDHLGSSVDVMMTRSDVLLFGVMRGSWQLPPDEVLRRDVGAKTGDTVPVGMSLVVPISRVSELLEQDEVKLHRSSVPPVFLADP
jgi:hypothetical protein